MNNFQISFLARMLSTRVRAEQQESQQESLKMKGDKVKLKRVAYVAGNLGSKRNLEFTKINEFENPKYVALGKNYAVCLTSSNDVLLKRWETLDTKKALKVTGIPKNVVDIDCNENTVYLRTKNGKVYYFEVNGAATVVEEFEIPKEKGFSFFSPWRVLIPSAPAITQMSINSYHGAFLTEDGRVFTAGDNSFGQCGRKQKPKVYAEDGTEVSAELVASSFGRARQVKSALKKHKIVKVQTGERHTVALTDEGEVFSFGDDTKLQLGLGDTRFQESDFEPWLAGIVYVPPSLKSTTLSDEIKFSYYDKHHLWKPTKIKTVRFQKLTDFGKCLNIACSAENSFFLYKDPEPDWKSRNTTVLFGCGENVKGQCGRSKSTHQQISMPVRLPKDVKIEEIRCGTGHCLATDVNKNLFVWGANSFGQCGVGHRADVCPPVNKKVKVVDFNAKYDNSVIIVEETE
jgi:alpha-tubulin suppressor-like RCC1 family protein